MDELLSEFLTETNESLATLDLELVKLEQNPNNPGLIDNIFRLVHTIKGTCGFLGLPRLEAVAHSSENVLGKIRDDEIEVTPEAVSLILASLDRIKEILYELEATEAEPEGDDGELIAQLDALALGETVTAVAEPEPVVEQPEAAASDTLGPILERELKPGEVSLEELERVFQETDGPASQAANDTLFDQLGGQAALDAVLDLFYEKVLADASVNFFFNDVDLDLLKSHMATFLSQAFGGPDAYTGRDLTEAHTRLVEVGLNDGHFDTVAGHLQATLEELDVAADLVDQVMSIAAGTRDAVLGKAAKAAASSKGKTKAKKTEDTAEPKNIDSAVANQSIRVSVDLLENLMTMVSELVLTRNQLLQMVRGQADSEFKVPLQRLSHVTTELQEGVMKTRMQPIGNAWAKLPRIIRDLSHELGKKIDLEMLGADTELDRQVLELIKDPLTHMVRNSADHGLETIKERLAAGKPETGKVVLNAYHEGGHIIIEITDDGRGLDVEKLGAKLLEKSLVSESELEGMSDQQIMQYIFAPGFSTAKKVTSVSGRGVGMDVVRTNIEKIGGTIDLKSAAGKGTSITIKIPLTLAIVSALIVECCEERFAIPQLSVVELVRASKNTEHRIENINQTPVLRLRNRLLPLVYLGHCLNLPGSEETTLTEGSEVFVVVTQVGSYSFGIVVDRVFDTEEIVVKPVAPLLRDITMFSGNTILGDGSVIMILDPNGISAATSETSAHDSDAQAEVGTQAARGDDTMALLVFRAGGEEPKAVPLSLVARLEEIEVESIEHANGQMMVQYRGSLMPLVKFDAAHQVRESGRQPILVFSDSDRNMGLLVDDIVDIVEDRMDVELKAEQAGSLGSAVISSKATEVIDVGHFLNQAFSDWFKTQDGQAFGEDGAGKRVLLVDDSPFFLNMLTPLLEVAGYRVTGVADPKAALELREAGEAFDIIISDIEMPGMDGFVFAEEVRRDSRWHDTPLVALSSHTNPKDFDRGREAGFNDYVAKFDSDALLNSLNQTISIAGSAA